MIKHLILELYEKVNNETASSKVIRRIEDILEENDFIEDNKAPRWFLEFLENILKRNDVNRSYYEYNPDEGDIANLLAELEEIIDAEWNDYGEAVEVKFPNLKMEACISTEGNFYEASAYD